MTTQLAAQPPDTEVTTDSIPFDWRRLLLLLCVAALEILWLGTFILVLLSYTENPFPVTLFQWYIPISFSIGLGIFCRRILLARQTPRRNQLVVLWSAYAASILFALSTLPFFEGYGLSFDYSAAFDVSQPILPDGIILLPIIAIAVIRGAALGRISLTPESVSIRLRFGVMMFFIATVLAAFVSDTYQDQFAREMLLIIPLFFACSLFASALARSSSLKIDSKDSKQPFGLSWMSFLSLTTLILTSISFTLALFLMQIDRDDVAALLKIPVAIIFTLIFALASPFLFLAELIFSSLRSGDGRQPVHITTGEKDPPQASNDTTQVDLSDFIHDAYHFLTHGIGLACLGVLIFVILFWIFLFLIQDDNNFLQRNKNNDEGTREGANKLRPALHQLAKSADSLGLTDRFGFIRRWFGELTIRWLYSRMENLATKRGVPRNASQTPHEYRLQLAQAFPDGASHIQIITNAYVAIRYGEIPEDAQSLNQVREAFEHLKEIITYQ